MGRHDEWPKSPIRAATHPSRPIYISVPFWKGQLPVMDKIAGHLVVATPDVVTYAALSYVTQFVTRETLFEAFAKAHDLYGLQGKPPKLAFPLEWPDTPWGRTSAKFSNQL